MTYYETPQGAKVFAGGAIDFGGSATLPTVSRLLSNLWARLARPRMLRIRELEPANTEFLAKKLYDAVYRDPAKKRLPIEFVLAHPAISLSNTMAGAASAILDSSPRSRARSQSS